MFTKTDAASACSRRSRRRGGLGQEPPLHGEALADALEVRAGFLRRFRQLLDEDDVESELPKAEDEAQPRPGIATVLRLVGERSADDCDGHGRSVCKPPGESSVFPQIEGCSGRATDRLHPGANSYSLAY